MDNPVEIGGAVFVAIVLAQGAFKLASKALDLLKVRNGRTPLNGQLTGAEGHLVELLSLISQTLKDIREPLTEMAQNIHDVKATVQGHSASIEKIKEDAAWLKTRDELRGRTPR